MTIKQKTLERVSELGLLAVIREPSPEITLDTVDSLIKGGVLDIETTFTTPGAAEVVRSLDEKFGERILLGMGTLTRIEQVDEAKSAGARFMVSPYLETNLPRQWSQVDKLP